MLSYGAHALHHAGLHVALVHYISPYSCPPHTVLVHVATLHTLPQCLLSTEADGALQHQHPAPLQGLQLLVADVL